MTNKIAVRVCFLFESTPPASFFSTHITHEDSI
jgi:hypothetical protein